MFIHVQLLWTGYKLHGLLSTKCRRPDNSIIVIEVNAGETNGYVSEDVRPNREQANRSGKKYSFDKMPVNLMKSDAWNESIGKIVEMRLVKTTSQQEIDGIYEYICKNLYSEMDKYLKILNKAKKTMEIQ